MPALGDEPIQKQKKKGAVLAPSIVLPSAVSAPRRSRTPQAADSYDTLRSAFDDLFKPIGPGGDTFGRLPGDPSPRVDVRTDFGGNRGSQMVLAQSEALRKEMLERFDSEIKMSTIRMLDPAVIQAEPETVAWNLGRSPEDQRAVAKALNLSIPWMSQRYSMAGSPGIMSYASAYASSTNQTEALRALEFVRQLPAEQQDIVLSTLRDPAAFVKLMTYDSVAADEFAYKYERDGNGTYEDGLDLYEAQHTEKGITHAEWFDAFVALQGVVPGLQEVPIFGLTEQNNLDMSNAALYGDLSKLTEEERQTLLAPMAGLSKVEQQKRIQEILEKAGIPFLFDADHPDAEAMATGFRQLFQMGSKGAFRIDTVATPTALEAFQEAPLHEALKFTQSVIDVTGKPFMAAMGAAASGIGAAGGAARRLAGGSERPDEDFDLAVKEESMKLMGLPFNLLHEQTTKFVGTMLSPFMDENSQDYHDFSEVGGAILDMIILKKAGKFLKGAKTGRTSWEGGALDPSMEMGVNVGLLERQYGRSVAGRFDGKIGDILNSPGAHPFRVLDQIMEEAGFKFTATTAEKAAAGPANVFEKVVNGSFLRRAFDKVEAVKNNADIPWDAKQAHLVEHFGHQVEPHIIRDLLDSPRQEMGKAFIDAITSRKRFHTDLADVETQLTKLRDQDLETAKAEQGFKDASRPVKRMEGDEATSYNEKAHAVVPEIQQRVTMGDGSLRGQQHTVQDLGGGLYKLEIEGEQGSLYVKLVDGEVQGYVEWGAFAGMPGKKFSSSIWVEEQFRGNGVGHDVLHAMWDDLGYSKPEHINAWIKSQTSFSDEGRALVASAARTYLDKKAGRAPINRQLDRLERLALETRQRDLLDETPGAPIFEYPRSSLFHASAYAPIARVERIWSNFMKPLNKIGLDPKKFVDDMPQYPKIWNPGHRDRPANWSTENSRIVSHYLRRAGVDDVTINRKMQEMFELDGKGSQDFFEWAESVADEIDRSLPADTPDEVRIGLTRPWKTLIEEKRYTTYDDLGGRGVNGAVQVRPEFPVARRDARDPTNQPIPQPSRPNEFIGHLMLPDVDLAIEATSWMRRAAGHPGLGEGKGIAKFGNWTKRANAKQLAFGALYVPAKTMMRVGTALWKAPILALRMPAVIMRIQIEQMMRMRQFADANALTFAPGGVPFKFSQVDVMLQHLSPTLASGKGGVNYLAGKVWNDPRYAKFASPQDMDLGTIHEQLIGSPRSETRSWISTAQFEMGGVLPEAKLYTGWSEHLYDLHTDWLTREFVRRGMDVDQFQAWINQDSRASQWYRDEMEPVLKDSDLGSLDPVAMQRAWLDNLSKTIETYTRGDPHLMELVATGKTGSNIKFRAETMPNGQKASVHYGDLNTRMDAIRTNLSDLQARKSLTPEEVRAKRVLQTQLRMVKEQRLNLEREFGEAVEGTGSVHLADGESLAGYLQREWEGHTLDMPSQIQVKNHYSVLETVSRDGGLRTIRRGWENAWYSLYRPMSWADTRFTRGSLYYQLAERKYKQLKGMGYDETSARDYAQMDAAAETRNVMYDLSARTSAQRATRDLLWFAPAHQEVLNTWLFKIPGQFGTGLVGKTAGRVIVAGKAKALLDLFRGLNIISKDEEGKDVINTPFMGPLVELLTGTEVPDTVRTDPSRFNMVNVSNPFPGMAIMPSWAIGRAAREWGGPLKDVADWMEETGLLFSKDTTSTPTQIGYFWEAAFGAKAPLEFLSPAYAQSRHDRSVDVGLQYAYADLVERGVEPPRVEDFFDMTDPLTKKPAMSADAETKYNRASADWMQQLMSLGEKYQRGAAFVGLIGSSVTPASLTVTDKDREEFFKFWNTVSVPKPPPGLTKEEEEQWLKTTAPARAIQDQIISDYLDQHPGSVAFETWYTTYTGKEGQSINTSDPLDEDWYQDFYDGQRRYVTGEEWTHLVMASNSERHYAEKRNAALKEIGGAGLNPVAILLNGYKKNTALAEIANERETWLAMNPDMEATLVKTRRAMSEEFGFPLETVQADRLAATTKMLKDIAPFFTTEAGTRKGSYRAMVGQLSAFYSETGEFGEPRTKTEKALDWYFDTVFQPWADEVYPLYEEANRISDMGRDASSIYEQIRKINDQALGNKMSHGGQEFPSPEEMLFGNKSPVEQEMSIYNWASKPPAWLTEFQLDKAGYAQFDGRNQMLREMASIDDQYYLAKEDTSPGSDYADRLEKWRYNTQLAIAQRYGEQGIGMFQLSQAAPATRLGITGFGKNNAAWEWAVATAQDLTNKIVAAEYSPRGYSELAMHYKTWFYKQLDTIRLQEDDFNGLIEDVGYALPDQDDPRIGVPLYEALFFGNFNTEYMPPELAIYGGV